MKLEYAVPCRGIEALADGTFAVLGAETNGFMSSSFPQQLAVVLLVCVTQAHGENPEGQLSIRVLNPMMEPCAPELGLPVHVTRNPLLPEGWTNRILVPVKVVFVAEQPGGYSAELSVSASSLSVPLIVLEAQTPSE